MAASHETGRLSNKMKIVFLDTEFTGEHRGTTLVSVGMVTRAGEEFYRCTNDFKLEQVSPWLEENVLAKIANEERIGSGQLAAELDAWLRRYSGGEKVHFCSAGKLLDILLVYDLYQHLAAGPDFHYLHSVPQFISHAAHIDLCSLFWCAGLDPGLDRAAFAGVSAEGRHDALGDARINRLCFEKLVANHSLDAFKTLI
jgi:hypothetical protein